MSLSVILVPLVSVLILCIPGLVLGMAAGLRPGTALVTSPLLTYGITTTAATVASLVDFPWNPFTLVVVTVLATLLVGAVRLAFDRDRPWQERLRPQPLRRPGWGDLAIAAGVLVGGTIAAGVLIAGFGRFGAPNQDWDYIFHANAVRLIADGNSVAPEAMRQINDWESPDFYYPNTFHALGAVVQDLTGATVFEVLNSQAMLVSLVAGAGVAWLLRRSGAPLAVTVATPVLLAGFASFPYDILWRGPLLPYAAGVAVIPAFLLLLHVALERRGVAPLLAGLGAAGLLGLHPSTALSAGIFAVVYLLFRWAAAPRGIVRDLLPLVVVGATAIVAAIPAVKGAILTGTDGAEQDWPAVESPGQAVGDLLLLNHAAAAPQYWLAALLIVGLVTLHRARYAWWWFGGAAITFALFVMSAAFDNQLVADLTRPWWNDRWRFAALAILGMAPLAAHGLHSLVQLVTRLVGEARPGLRERVHRPALHLGLVAAALLVVALLSNGLYAPSNAARIAQNHQQQRTLSADEVAAMRWLAEHSTGGTIMNDSNDGSAYLSAVTGLRPLFGHVVNPPLIPRMGPTQQLLLERFNCLDSDPAVQQAIEDLDIRYVFLGSGYVRDFFGRVPGLVGVAASPSLELVHSTPETQIYEVRLSGTSETSPVTACTAGGNEEPTPEG